MAHGASAAEELANIQRMGSGIRDEVNKQAPLIQEQYAHMPPAVVPTARPGFLTRDAVVQAQQAAVTELDTLRAARVAQSAAPAPAIMVAECNARALSEFFATFGDAGIDPNSTALPTAFATRILGSVMTAPGARRVDGAQADSAQAEQERLRGLSDLIASTSHVSQVFLASLNTCISAARSSDVLHVPTPDMFTPQALEEQIVTTLPGARPCSRGATCVVTQLPALPNGIRLPLKAYQKPAAWAAFRSTGRWIVEGDSGKTPMLCVPCLLQMYTVAARARQQAGASCADIHFPFQVTSSCTGGFAANYIATDHTMPLAWPMIDARCYVPECRTVTYKYLNAETGRLEPRTETAYGYRFSDAVLFDDSVYTCGADEHMTVPPRAAPVVCVMDVDHISLPEVLRSDAEKQMAARISYTPKLLDEIQRLFCELEGTLRPCMSADEASEVFLHGEFDKYWHAALQRVPQNVLALMGDYSPQKLSTHAITTAVLARTGMCYTFERTELNGNANLDNFLNAHTALQKFVYKRWTELRHPPSDRELVGDELAYLTAETIGAHLHMKQLYPVYDVPRLSATQHQQVRVRRVYHRRTPPVETVRRAELPAEVCSADCRGALRWLVAECAELSAAASGAWVAATGAPDSLAALLPSLPRATAKWLAQAISLVALQVDFDDSVWLLGALAERWAWFAPAAAALTSSASLPLPAAAAEALNGGRWAPPPDLSAPARQAAMPGDAPAFVQAIKGYRRFTAEYVPAGSDTPVNLGAHLFPDSLINLLSPGANSGRYTVLAALRCRIYELQRICKRHERVLLHAFDARMQESRDKAAAAHSPAGHPERDIVDVVRQAMTDSGVPGKHDWLPIGGTSVQATRHIAAGWPTEVYERVTNAVEANTVLVESIGAELLGPLFNGCDSAVAPPQLGPPVDTADAYAARCALFECLELAHQARFASDASDLHWFAIPPDSAVSHLHQLRPLANGAPCEDSLPDLSPYIGLNMLREPGAASFLTESSVHLSWVTQVATVTHKACFMRDWVESHAKNCKHSEYAAWAAQSLLVTALGTYRHACRTLPFARALELYGELRMENAETLEGRRALAHFLKRNTYLTMVAGQEFQMMTLAGTPAESCVLRAAWPSFAYAQECWVPQRAERIRAVLARADASLESKEAYACHMVRSGDTPSSDPRVFRHLPPSWPLTMLDTFSRIEIERQTGIIDSNEQIVNLLPRFVNTVPAETKHAMVDMFSATDPTEPIRLAWFARCGVGADGLARLAMANAVYAVQGESKMLNYLVSTMSESDFFYAWTAMHIMVLHRDTIVQPVPWSLARRQYAAAQYRAGNMTEPPPRSFTHAVFCHLLGCAGPQTYTVPMTDAEHYGADETMLASDMGVQVCARNCTDEIFQRLVRRSKESPVQEGLNQLDALRSALEATADPSARALIQSDIGKLREKLITQQAKNVRATAAVAFNRPCNAAPSRQLPCVGRFIVERNSVHARSTPRVYTTCPMCGVLTIYSMDRYGANGFSCGRCTHEERWALHGNWCVSCGAVEQGGPLPQLIGEAQAAARAARTEHQICGSTSRPHSLRSGASRRRHDELLRRQELADAAAADVAAGKMLDIDGKKIDTSDVLAAPATSRADKAAADTASAKKPRVRRRRQNIAVAYELGRNLAAVHPCAVRMRMDRFAQMPLIDDRVGGLNTTAFFSVCRPCLTRVRSQTVSLTKLLEQSQAPVEEIWVGGRRIAVGGRVNRRRFVRRAAAPTAARKARKLVMLDA